MTPMRAPAPARPHEALDEGGWFGERARGAGRARPRDEADPGERVRAVRTLLAEETRLGMLVGVAVGWELARELDRDRRRRGD